jgi:hypothetical protein
MEPQHGKKESRWHRPDSYITVVSIYLMFLAAVTSSMLAYFSYSNAVVPAIMTPSILAVFTYMQHLVITPVILVWITFFMAGGSIIWAVPSVIGAVLMLYRRKIGVFISLASLIFLLFGSSMLTSIFMAQNPFAVPSIFMGPALGLLIGTLLIVSAAIMCAFLIIGWKRVQWK